MGPFHLTADWGTWISYLVPLLIGVGFGAVLEMSGFGDSRKLAAQFYLKDMTVLKVMFTAIVVAGVLLGASSALGLLNMDLVWINPTFLVPGIVGGLVMGFGFIMGGFCPGTSLVATSTLKLDGLFFALGVTVGIFLFSETVHFFEGFWSSTAMGRFTLAELFRVDTGVVLMGVVGMAMLMFLGAELAEDFFGRGTKPRELRFFPKNKKAYGFAIVLFAIAFVAAMKGEPDALEKWKHMASTRAQDLETRQVFVHPMEIAELLQDTTVYARILDVRIEADYNLFHLKNAKRVSLEELEDSNYIKSLRQAPSNTVFFVMSNDETEAAKAWKLLVAQGILNVYIAEGGINQWLTVFPPLPCLAKPLKAKQKDEKLAFEFYRAVGDCCDTAFPKTPHKTIPSDCYLSANPEQSSLRSKAGEETVPEPKHDFERKVKMQKKKALKGGCG